MGYAGGKTVIVVVKKLLDVEPCSSEAITVSSWKDAYLALVVVKTEAMLTKNH